MADEEYDFGAPKRNLNVKTERLADGVDRNVQAQAPPPALPPPQCDQKEDSSESPQLFDQKEETSASAQPQVNQKEEVPVSSQISSDSQGSSDSEDQEVPTPTSSPTSSSPPTTTDPPSPPPLPRDPNAGDPSSGVPSTPKDVSVIAESNAKTALNNIRTSHRVNKPKSPKKKGGKSPAKLDKKIKKAKLYKKKEKDNSSSSSSSTRM